MNYEQFTAAIFECAKKKLSESALVEKQKILKNNGVMAIGISIRKKGENAAPIIYLEEYFKKYCLGADLETLTEHLIERSKSAPPAPLWEYEDFLDFRKIRHQVIYKLVNAKKNEKLLKEVPNLPMFDLAIVFCVMIPVNEGEYCSILIRNVHMDYWELPISLLYQCAKENTRRLCPYVFRPMEVYVKDHTGVGVPESPLLVLSNESGVNGASVLLYPGMPKYLYESIGKNYYLLPSSIHEFLIVPEEEGVFSVHLKEIVKEVNENHIAEEEFLSDSVYYFDGNIITKM